MPIGVGEDEGTTHEQDIAARDAEGAVDAEVEEGRGIAEEAPELRAGEVGKRARGPPREVCFVGRRGPAE